VVRAAADRIKVAGDVLDYTSFFVEDSGLSYDEAALDKRLRSVEGAAALLRRFGDRLAGLEAFDPASIERELQNFVQAEGIGHAQIIHSLRLATTGKTVGFGLFDSLAILGRSQCLARIERALARV
jgi:glutamyl-tRNA synthetase